MILVTPAEMESIDAATIGQHGLPSLVLMENAARSVLPHIPPGPVTVLVGPGNNGGDGLVIARALKELGRTVETWLLSEKLSPDAATQLALAEQWGVPAVRLFGGDPAVPGLSAGRVVVDALFGTGLGRDLEGRYARVLEVANQADVFRLAVDIPSGVDGATGRVMGVSFQAHATVTFGLAKWGHVLYPGKSRCGNLILTQPGFHPEALGRCDRVRYVTPALAATLLPSGWPTMHKGDNGRVLLVTGSATYPGAGVLSTLGALRGGGGLVTYAGDERLRRDVLSWAPEALLVERETIEGLESYNVLVLGSGLGPEAESVGSDLLARFPGPVVVDADALKLVPRFASERRRSWVLTPHPGELSRLLERPVAELENNRIGTALEAAASLGAVVCCKGAPTVCAAPDGRAFVCSTGNPLLAQGGSGDVLAGLIGAYIGYGLPALEATAAAVHVHGLAADLHAQGGSPRGVGARAIAERIPEAFGLAVGKNCSFAVL
jgi:NAD(P)H-hydrate epimerase